MCELSSHGCCVGDAVGEALGEAVGDAEGDTEGDAEGDGVGAELGASVGDKEGDRVGDKLGEVVGAVVGLVEGAAVGLTDGACVGCAVGWLLTVKLLPVVVAVTGVPALPARSEKAMLMEFDPPTTHPLSLLTVVYVAVHELVLLPTFATVMVLDTLQLLPPFIVAMTELALRASLDVMFIVMSWPMYTTPTRTRLY